MTHRESSLEKLLLIFSLGLTEAIKAKAVSIDDAEKLLYSPHTMKLLKKFELNEGVVDLVHLGTELEDIDSILPDRLTANLDKMSELAVDILRKAPAVDAGEPRWYEKLLDD